MEEIGVDIIRAPTNKSHNYSLIILITGHGQVGKTTAVWYLANRMMQIRQGKLYLDDPRITWREWDWARNTAITAQDFVRLWNDNTDAILALAEPSTKLYYMEWMGVMGRVFNSTTTTQGKQRNICFLDTVMATEIMQKARDKVDYRIAMYNRNDYYRTVQARSGFVNMDYLRDKWMLITYPTFDVEYSKRMILMAKQYTDWISATLKKDEAEENELRVGLRKQMVICYKCGSVHEMGECPLKLSYETPLSTAR